MITDALREYVSENLQKGFAKEALEQALLSSGYASADVEQVFREHDGGVGGHHAPIASAADTPAFDSKTDLTSQLGAKVSEVAPVPSVGNIPAESLSPNVFDNRTHPLPSSPRFVLWGAIGAGVILVVLGAVAAYYFMIPRTPMPEAVFTEMRKNMSELHSYAFAVKVSMNFTGAPKEEVLQAANNYFGKGTEGKLNVTVTATGAVIAGESATTSQTSVQYVLAGNVTYGAFSIVLDGEAEVRAVDGVIYVRTIKFPQLLSMFGFGPMLTEWQGKWIMIDPKATSSLSSIVPAQYGATSTASADILPTGEEQARAKEILKKDWPVLVTSVEEKDAPLIDGGEMYHYRFSLDKEKLHTFFVDALTLYPGRTVSYDSRTKKEGIDMATNLFASTTGELFIGKKDMLLHRASVNVPVTIATSSVSLSGAISVDLQVSQWNAVPPIVPPSSAVSIEKVLADITASTQGALSAAQMKSRDAKRISDVGQIRLTLELYYDRYLRYPVALSSLVTSEFFSMLPVDPIDKTAYPYHVLAKNGKAGQSYVLGASLENKENGVLATDKDTADTVVHGNDATGCRLEKERYCYDVAP